MDALVPVSLAASAEARNVSQHVRLVDRVGVSKMRVLRRVADVDRERARSKLHPGRHSSAQEEKRGATTQQDASRESAGV
jgi:hypothetical protein